MSGTDAFTPAIYDAVRDGAQRSAAIVAPIVFALELADLDYVPLVYDVGCGEGHWAAAFAAAQFACTVVGFDGPHVDHVLGDRFTPVDLTQPLPDLKPADLVVCLEVGEHLPEHRAAGLVDDLCRLAPVVLFSAAIPHQTGPGHITCRWPSWWAGHFARNGYGLDGQARFAFWDDDRIEPWYRQNILIARRGAPTVGPLDVVHPIIHGWGR